MWLASIIVKLISGFLLLLSALQVFSWMNWTGWLEQSCYLEPAHVCMWTKPISITTGGPPSYHKHNQSYRLVLPSVSTLDPSGHAKWCDWSISTLDTSLLRSEIIGLGIRHHPSELTISSWHTVHVLHGMLISLRVLTWHQSYCALLIPEKSLLILI